MLTNEYSTMTVNISDTKEILSNDREKSGDKLGVL